ncbi:5'/3'-nucleotidase SurE [Silvanigrella aquatica]|uniref:5'-nucleotidase SurE n=1 Tax=Silvanigrella aquatica TaxID=1915309 RepID=A0A1L4CZG6_9BACT|nr:5'/3'-nucleotidase SurE [Silvanigrella aquatica]APJ03342.1 5'/3'-nucleotidase SurE [Silvanigrella aquatica]
MHLLLCNDDGYKAKGIRVLAKYLSSLGHKITVVAPNGERSAQSHAMTFYHPLRVRLVAEGVYAVDGTPADCAALGLHKILAENPPDFVVSGINHGLNVGIDVNYSGTVGAATEAALMGFKAIAISADSEDLEGEELEAVFLKAAKIVGEVLEKSHILEWPKLEVLNINVPKQANEITLAECGGESLYVPHIEELSSRYKKNLKIYLIGGLSRHEPKDMSQDVSLIRSNKVTLSFVKAKQSSSESNKNLEILIGKIKL